MIKGLKDNVSQFKTHSGSHCCVFATVTGAEGMSVRENLGQQFTFPWCGRPIQKLLWLLCMKKALGNGI